MKCIPPTSLRGPQPDGQPGGRDGNGGGGGQRSRPVHPDRHTCPFILFGSMFIPDQDLPLPTLLNFNHCFVRNFFIFSRPGVIVNPEIIASLYSQTPQVYSSILQLQEPFLLFFSFAFFFFLCFFRAAPMACGGPQARGQIGAAAASHSHSHSNGASELPLRPTRQRRILNPLSEVRNPTCNLMVPSQIHFH